MADHLAIDIFGVLHGAADGKLAIGVLALVALTATKAIWWR